MMMESHYSTLNWQHKLELEMKHWIIKESFNNTVLQINLHKLQIAVRFLILCIFQGFLLLLWIMHFFPAENPHGIQFKLSLFILYRKLIKHKDLQ